MRPFIAGALVLLLSVVLACPAGAAVSKPIPLWPGTAPGDQADPGPERDTTKDTDNLVGGRRLIRLGNVSQPTLTVYSPKKSKANGTAMMVCPGGGYNILAMDLEGTEVCEWLNSIGVTALLLKYRVPKRPDRERHAAPLQDAQRAFSLAQQRAAEWGFDPRRVGVLGFSAGAHLSATFSTTAQRTYPAVDAADQTPLRPAFTVLIYPAYLVRKEQPDQTPPEISPGTNTPPTFIAMSQDDPVGVGNALGYAQVLQKLKVPLELHVYPTGGHGYGLRRTADPVTSWPDRLADWMRASGWLTRPGQGR